MRYLSFSQLSQKLGGRSRSSIYRDIACGQLPPPFKLGGRRYWRELDIDHALDCINEPTSDQSMTETRDDTGASPIELDSSS